MITLDNAYKTRNPSNISFSFETDEGNITYTLYIYPEYGKSSTNNPFYLSIELTSSNPNVVVDGTTWTYTLESEYLYNMFNVPTKYNWYVSGTTDSSISMFYWKPYIDKTEWSVDPIPEQTTSKILKVSGTYSSSISKIVVNDVSAELLSGVWKAKINLISGINSITITATDKWDIQKTEKRTTTLVTNIGSYINNWVHFDEYGLFSGINRQNGEEFYSFEKARSFVKENRVNSSYRGIINGLCADLRLYTKPIIRIKKLIKPGQTQSLPYNKSYINVDSRYIRYYTDQMVKEQEGIVDAFGRIILQYEAVEHTIRVFVDNKEVFCEVINNNLLRLDNKYINKKYTVVYNYSEKIAKISATVATVLSFFNNSGVFDTTYLEKIPTTTSATYIVNTSGWVTDTVLYYSPVKLYALGDSITKETLSSEQPAILEADINAPCPKNTYIFPGTMMEGYCDELRSTFNYGWENITLGITHWYNESLLARSYLSRIYDAKYRRYGVYEPPVAEYLEKTTFSGIKKFKGGIGYGKDLEPLI